MHNAPKDSIDLKSETVSNFLLPRIGWFQHPPLQSPILVVQSPTVYPFIILPAECLSVPCLQCVQIKAVGDWAMIFKSCEQLLLVSNFAVYCARWLAESWVQLWHELNGNWNVPTLQATFHKHCPVCGCVKAYQGLPGLFVPSFLHRTKRRAVCDAMFLVLVCSLLVTIVRITKRTFLLAG